MHRPALAAAVVALALPFAAPPTAAQETGAPPRVVASIKPVHSLAAGVMAGVATPRLLVDAAQSPHTYALKPSEARALEAADLVVWVGPALEAFLTRPVSNIAPDGASMPLLAVDGLTRWPTRAGGTWERHAHADAGHDHGHGHDDDKDDGHGHGHGHDHDHNRSDTRADTDPHVWLDPANAKAIVRALAERLAEADPARAETYRANAREMAARIEAAAADARQMLAPVADVPYVVFHDAYQYYERAFGLNAVGSITLSPDRQPGAGRLVAVREKIAELDARCIFREPQFAPDLVRTVVENTPARVAALDPLGLDQPAGPAAYPALIRQLAHDLAGCLGRANG